MPNIRIVKRYTRADLQAHPKERFVFGDNLMRVGRGGQARECRDEPNAIGIPTKHSPWTFLKDDDLPFWRKATFGDFRLLENAIAEGRAIVWPEDGIGTGLAELETRAPEIWAKLQRRLADLGLPVAHIIEEDFGDFRKRIGPTFGTREAAERWATVPSASWTRPYYFVPVA